MKKVLAILLDAARARLGIGCVAHDDTLRANQFNDPRPISPWLTLNGMR